MIAGPHCYSFFDGNAGFAARGDAEMRAFYLTDFLVRQFDAFVWRPMGLDRHPELRDMIFGNYQALIYLAQTEDPPRRRGGRAPPGSGSPTSGASPATATSRRRWRRSDPVPASRARKGRRRGRSTLARVQFVIGAKGRALCNGSFADEVIEVGNGGRAGGAEAGAEIIPEADAKLDTGLEEAEEGVAAGASGGGAGAA